MDRPIPKQTWTPRRIAIVAAAGLGAVGLIYWVAVSSGRTQLGVDSQRLTVAQVQKGEFQEYVPVNGSVQPNTTVYLDLEEGGIVEKVHVQGGSAVKQGELILSFSNSSAQKQNIETETRLLENLNQLRNSKLSLTTSSLILQDQLLDLSYKIQDLEKTFARYERLMKDPSSQLSKEQFETTQYQLTYYKNKRELLQERIRREAELQDQQSRQIESSIARINRNLEIMARIIDSLEVRAPIDGQLSVLNAQVGQSFQRGQRIGQIDQSEGFKVRADIDQYYIAKVAAGQRGRFEFAGRDYELQVAKVYSEVKDDTFPVDLKFVDGAPEGIRRGQTLQIELSLSEARTVNMVEKGSFYRYTNGRWAYMVAPDGLSAQRTAIVLGRQNPRAVEVLDGLKGGDWIITSSYENFHDVDRLTFAESINR